MIWLEEIINDIVIKKIPFSGYGVDT